MKKTGWIKDLYNVIHAGLNLKHLQNNAGVKTLAGLWFPLWISALLHLTKPFLFTVRSETYVQLFSPLLVPYLTHTHIYFEINSLEFEPHFLWPFFLLLLLLWKQSIDLGHSWEICFKMHKPQKLRFCAFHLCYQAAQVAKILLQIMKVFFMSHESFKHSAEQAGVNTTSQNLGFLWHVGAKAPENVDFVWDSKSIRHYYVWSALLAAASNKWDHIFFCSLHL